MLVPVWRNELSKLGDNLCYTLSLCERLLNLELSTHFLHFPLLDLFRDLRQVLPARRRQGEGQAQDPPGGAVCSAEILRPTHLGHGQENLGKDRQDQGERQGKALSLVSQEIFLSGLYQWCHITFLMRANRIGPIFTQARRTVVCFIFTQPASIIHWVESKQFRII